MIKYQELGYKSFVADDGSYGIDTIVVFDPDDLYDQFPGVWDIIEQIGDNYKYDFVIAFLEQNFEVLEEAAAEYDFDISLVTDKDN